MKYLRFLFSPALMGFLFVAFALSMAVATFLENDFGSPVAYSMVYNTRWFELILLLLAANLIGQLIIYKLFRRPNCRLHLFHLSFLLLIMVQELQGISDGKAQCISVKERSSRNVIHLINILSLLSRKQMEQFPRAVG